MTLKYTADQVRDREAALIGIVGKPNPWWAWGGGSDCMAAQATILGLRSSRADQAPHLISIAAFRSYFGWDEVPMSEARGGDLVAEWWPERNGEEMPSNPLPRHIEMIYSITPTEIETTSANTGPHPGVADPNGFYRKTRTLTRNFLFAIRVPYKGAPATSPYGTKHPVGAGSKDVKLVATFLNDKIAGKDHLTVTTSYKDGVVGPNYWTLVQTWGRENRIYGAGFKIDGIPGPRTRQVEAVIVLRAKAAGKL